MSSPITTPVRDKETDPVLMENDYYKNEKGLPVEDIDLNNNVSAKIKILWLVNAFAEEKRMNDVLPLLLKGALVAQDPPAFERVPEQKKSDWSSAARLNTSGASPSSLLNNNHILHWCSRAWLGPDRFKWRKPHFQWCLVFLTQTPTTLIIAEILGLLA
ncbi:hypothetical protein V1527DRAFT_485964 [Lipomyces starkeyi]